MSLFYDIIIKKSGDLQMIDFITNIAYSIEDFFATSAATAIGAVFLGVITVLILLLIKYFEQN